jgi:hypothetical protein
MFIKADENGTILNHWHMADQDLGITIEIPNQLLVNSLGDYIYKYSNGEVVSLTEQEISSHPCYTARKIGELKTLAARSIAALDELKAHSIAAKKGEGIELTEDEQAFLTDFLTARQAILDQYELDKQAYE